jgi:dipeptidyl aminopeptidase/acylaminoacyl peptidase
MNSKGRSMKAAGKEAADGSAIERFGLEHGGRIVQLSDPQIAPDGRSIVVVVSRANFDENRYDVELVLVDVASRAHKVLTRRQASQPRWSPSGQSLAFLSQVDEKAQIFVIPIDGGEAMQISKAPMGVDSYSWRPDCGAFAYLSKEEPAEREGQERHNRSFEADVNYLLTETPRAHHLWLVPADGGEAKRLTSGEWSVAAGLTAGSAGAPSWSPDGKAIAFAQQPLPGPRYIMDVSIRILEVATGSIRPLNELKHRMSGAAFSPDGKFVSYSYPRDGDSRFGGEIFIAPAVGGDGRSLTHDLDRNVRTSRWMPDSRSLLIRANDGTTPGLWIQPIDGPVLRLDTGSAVPGSAMTVSRSGQIALLASEPDRPTELYYLAAPGSQLQRLTDFNAHIAALELGKQEPISWRGADDFDMDGILTYPPGYQPGQPYPLALLIHGGPRGTSTMGFSERAQWLASHGWVVFQPNYRGSDNLGNDYQAAIWNDAGAGPGRDVMSGVDLLIQRGIADPSRMAVSGWSYGGYMTTWLLGNYPDRWRAGVAGASVTDHIDQYVLSDIHSSVATYYGGSPFTDPKRLKAYREQAPITYATHIKAPTLVLCDTGDQRVPISESFILYHVLRDNGVKTKFIAYPVAGHNPSDPVHQRDRDRRWAAWLQEHLGANSH